MKLITFEYRGQEQIGLLSKDGQRVAPAAALGFSWRTMNDLILEITEEEKETLRNAGPEAFSLSAGDVRLLAPIPHPLQDVICLGLNYTEHAAEAAGYSREAFVKKEARHAVYFSKRVGTAPGPEGIIPAWENLVDRLDYEVELAVILGKDAFQVKREDVRLPSLLLGP